MTDGLPPELKSHLETYLHDEKSRIQCLEKWRYWYNNNNNNTKLLALYWFSRPYLGLFFVTRHLITPSLLFGVNKFSWFFLGRINLEILSINLIVNYLPFGVKRALKLTWLRASTNVCGIRQKRRRGSQDVAVRSLGRGIQREGEKRRGNSRQ